eukprot:356442_1
MLPLKSIFQSKKMFAKNCATLVCASTTFFTYHYRNKSFGANSETILHDKSILQQVIDSYKTSGILIRGNDGQTPLTINKIKNVIANSKFITDRCNTDLSLTLENESPPYSSSLLSGLHNNLPILWYNHDYVEAFDVSHELGNRTIIAVIFNNYNISIIGGCCFDADSNERNLGNIPNTFRHFNKATPNSYFSQVNVFNNIAKYVAPIPSSLNNHPAFNPMIFPFTNNNIADNIYDINLYLDMITELKSIWINTIKNENNSNGYNDIFANYLNDVYNLGLECEILIEPKNNQPYYMKKFNINDVLCFAFITDYPNIDEYINNKNISEFENAKYKFIKTCTDVESGWINNNGNDESEWDNIPMIVINHVSLPNVPLSGTHASSNNIGKEWVTYLTDTKYLYDKPLTEHNFRLLSGCK